MCRAAHGPVGPDGSLQPHTDAMSVAGTVALASGAVAVTAGPTLDNEVTVSHFCQHRFCAQRIQLMPLLQPPDGPWNAHGQGSLNISTLNTWSPLILPPSIVDSTVALLQLPLQAHDLSI